MEIVLLRGGEVYRIVIPANTTFLRAIQIYGGLGGGTTVNASADTAPNTVFLNVWYHGVAVFESVSSRSIYLNGIFYTTNTTVLIPSIVANIHIGANFQANLPSGGGHFAGNIADVGMWNTSLSSSEIFSLSSGVTCDKVRPQNLSFYAPLIRDLQDTKGGLIITPNNGPIATTHPRIYK